MASRYTSGKVAIPKLDRGLHPPPPKVPPSQNREDRVVRACKNCRKRKVKCSGDVPRCVVCQTNDLNCVYEQSRRDRLKEASDLNYVFLNLFKDISPRLGDEDRKRIQDVIDVAEDDILEPSSTAVSVKSLGKRSRNRSASQSPDDIGPTKKQGEAHVTASVGSNEDLDYLDEDLMRSLDARQTGYVGQNSEVQWLRSVQRQSRGEPMDMPYGPPGSSAHAIDERAKAHHERRTYDTLAPTTTVTEATFYLDNDNIDLEIAVNAYELPDPGLAEQLLECYMNAIHNSFPVVPLNFDVQARKFISAVRQNKAFRVPDRWRALLNLIFAIGARHAYLSGNQSEGTERDHLVFMTRASQLLGMSDHVALTSSPDLPLIQATAVFSLYFLIIGHVSRAWLTIGLSIRIAMALGLYLRIEVPELDASRKETLERTWWSLHSIETLVSSITGRPPTISIENTTVPLPRGNYSHKRQARNEHLSHTMQEPPGGSHTSRSPGSLDFLTSNLDISLLTQKALSELYSPKTAIKSWQDIQQSMKALLQELEDWSDRILGPDTPSPGNAHAHQLERETMLLRMSYWSTRISITRPCLCRTERRIKNQSDSSAKFNSDMALSCVESARALTALFPDIPDPQFIYLKAPWWNVVHIIMQCAAVLLLEIGYQNQHVKYSNSGITSDLQKLVSWIHLIGQKDSCARRAYLVLQRISREVAPHLRLKADEALSEKVASEKTANLSNSFFASSTSQQNDGGTWIQGHPSVSQTADIDPQLSSQDDQYLMLPLSEFSADDRMGAGGMPILNGSGNPFVNSWDECMPFDVQNFWLQDRSFVANSSAFSGDVRTHPWEEFQDQYQQQDQRPGSTADRVDGAGL